ncbi:MAG: ABC transporter ATP-binding protein [Planctomycetota bacterium]|jgi:oligopeptide transport system ATP-binding protein
MALLEVGDLHVSFKTDDGIVHAVQGIDYALDPGQTLGIVGESGCGKSVCTMALMRLIPEPPGRIEGRVTFDDEDVLALPASRMREIRGNRIAMIFQDPMTCLNPFLRVSTQVVEAIELHTALKGRAARHRAVEALERVGIPGAAQRLDEYPHQFSGGMRQRVMIAMALACEPQLLIADEPTTALDVTIQAQILELIKRLVVEDRMALILITHALGVVAGICERIAVMYGGRFVETAPTRDLFADPQHPYTEALLRAVPRLDETVHEKLSAIEGMPPQLDRPFVACPFEPRCPLREERCRAGVPDLVASGAGRAHACRVRQERGLL